MSIPFDDIKDTLDRSWSERLLSLLETASEDDPVADDAVDVLSDLVDPAITDRLFHIGTNLSADPVARSRALEVICDSGLSLEGDALRVWWNSDDRLLQKEALEDAYRTEADYVRPVAADPLHPLHRYAIAALEFGFDDPEWQSYIVGSLSHFDPAVQELGADLAVWEEPIAAQDKLIELANGTNTDVAIRSIRTLAFFRSRAVLTALDDLVHYPDEERSGEARDAAENVAAEFQSELNNADGPATRERLTAWMQPVLGAVALHDVDRSMDRSSFVEQETSSLPVHGQELAAALLDTGGCWREKMRWLKEADWLREPETDRRLLRKVLLHHVDPIVRMQANRIMADWDDVDALVELAHDRYVMVRQQATISLSSVTSSPAVAEWLWPLIANDKLGGWSAREALASWMHHSPDDPTERLVDIALNDTRLGLRWSAINNLGSDKADLIVTLLDQPPQVNWAAHSLLLGNLREHPTKLPALDNFLEVDDLYVAAACADFAAFD